ncbi:hypothetical protein ACFSUS_16760 [Spirosoma soli]|uniref:Uncharacterized protein n=1 Tax=Spirosoma soli TaxID=1770529 RepID=A0ABW5M7E3_9BACT
MIQILLIALISLLAQLILPWWSLAIVSFLITFWLSPSAGRAFLYGFVGVALVWLGYALLIYVRSDGTFAGRISQLLLQMNNSTLLLLLTAVVGGLVGGLAGAAGFFVRQAIRNQIINPTS